MPRFFIRNDISFEIRLVTVDCGSYSIKKEPKVLSCISRAGIHWAELFPTISMVIKFQK